MYIDNETIIDNTPSKIKYYSGSFNSSCIEIWRTNLEQHWTREVSADEWVPARIDCF